MPKRRSRGCLLWLGRFIIFVLGLMLVGAIYESAAEAADVRAFPPPGQLVDVGGYRLHLNCSSAGSPTVVIDAGLSDWSTMWGFVQPDVAKTTRVCTYDRAGMGWSEAGPLPRNVQQFAKELHAYSLVGGMKAWRTADEGSLIVKRMARTIPLARVAAGTDSSRTLQTEFCPVD
jgi:hypothetical protein